MENRNEIIVVKFGTSVISRKEGLDLNVMADLARDISTIIEDTQYKVVLVSSGAIGHGSTMVDLPTDADSVSRDQVYASLGQQGLINTYRSLFATAKPKRDVAQLLLTHANFQKPIERENILKMLNLMPRNVVPIVNENDTVATEELKGDNDELAALVAVLIKAKILVLLTNVDGVFANRDDDKPLVNLPSPDITDEFIEECDFGKDENGRGGIRSKLIAARNASHAGIDVVIAHGKKVKLSDAIYGKRVGTRIAAHLPIL